MAAHTNYPKEVYQTKIYRSWANMKRRCNNPQDKRYAHYGGRGISYAPEWEKFDGFYADMSAGYRDDLFLDRVDNNKGYSKNNCRWATMEQQMNNMSTNRVFTIHGITDTFMGWIRRSGVAPSTARQRFYVYHWDIERSLGLRG